MFNIYQPGLHCTEARPNSKGDMLKCIEKLEKISDEFNNHFYVQSIWSNIKINEKWE